MRRVILVVLVATLSMPLASAGEDPDHDCAEPVHTVCADVDGAIAGLCTLGQRHAVVCTWQIDATMTLWTEEALAGYGDLVLYARPEVHYEDGTTEAWGTLLNGYCEWEAPETGCNVASLQRDVHVGRALGPDECATGLIDLRAAAYAQPATGIVSSTDAGQFDAVVAEDRMERLWLGQVCR